MGEVFDPSTPAGGRALGRLADELIIWMTTVSPAGQPQPAPVWFWWDGSQVLVYSGTGGVRLRNLAVNPQVALHLDGNGTGGDVVIIEGEARHDPQAPPAHQHPEYVAKYRQRMRRNGWTPERFAELYPAAIRVRLRRVRYW